MSSAPQRDDSKYQYLNLETSDCIRLLVLLPSSSPNDDLKCLLRHVKLNDSPQFEALSYCWGESILSRKITVGHSDLHVTNNLHNSLKSLRFVEKERLLWVDAVCVNQNDNDERNIQVAMMDLIYQRAHRVVAWLGEDEDESALMAFESATQLYQIGRKFGLDSLEPSRSGGDPRANRTLKAAFEAHKSEIKVGLQDIDVDSLLSLLKRDWFSRIWTIQEITLSTVAVVQSGRRYISWNMLSTSVYILYNESFSNHSLGEPLIPKNCIADLANAYMCVLVRLDDVWRTRIDAATSIEHILAFEIVPYLVMAGQANKFAIRGCKDDRDRLYALLSLWPKKMKNKPLGFKPFKPNYNRNVEEVYTDFARCALRAGALEILNFSSLWFAQPSQPYAASVVGGDHALPSWVPEFRISRQPFVQEFRRQFVLHPDLPWACVESQDSYAKRDLKDSIKIPVDGNRISIIGVVFDEVSAARFGIILGDPNPDSVLAWLTSCLLLFHETTVGNTYHPTREPKNVAFARTIAADGPLNINDNSDSRTIPQQPNFEDLLRRYATRPLYDYPDSHNTEEMLSYISTLSYVHSLCAFFLTKEALIGLGPHIAAVGDVVVHLNGLRWPFLLRPVRGSANFQLVGQCYLHGYMRGEKNFPGESRSFSLI